MSATPGAEPREPSPYKAGFIDGVRAYAHWKDGRQEVGTTGTLLRNAIRDVEDTWNYAHELDVVPTPPASAPGGTERTQIVGPDGPQDAYEALHRTDEELRTTILGPAGERDLRKMAALMALLSRARPGGGAQREAAWAEIVKLAVQYEADPVNANDRPSSWAKLAALLSAIHEAAALSSTSGAAREPVRAEWVQGGLVIGCDHGMPSAVNVNGEHFARATREEAPHDPDEIRVRLLTGAHTPPTGSINIIRAEDGPGEWSGEVLPVGRSAPSSEASE